MFSAQLRASPPHLCNALYSLQSRERQQQWVTLVLSQETPLLIRTESDDLSVEASLHIPKDWFSSFSVTTPMRLSVELNALIFALQLGKTNRSCSNEALGEEGVGENLRTVTFDYDGAVSHGLTVLVSPERTIEAEIETVLFVKTDLAEPLNMSFSSFHVVAHLECEIALMREVVQSFMSYTCTHIGVSLHRESEVVTFKGLGGVYGSLTISLQCSSGSTLELFGDSDVYHEYLMGHCAMLFGCGNKSTFGEGNCLVVQWNQKGMASVSFPSSSSDFLSRAVIEKCMLPVFLR